MYLRTACRVAVADEFETEIIEFHHLGVRLIDTELHEERVAGSYHVGDTSRRQRRAVHFEYRTELVARVLVCRTKFIDACRTGDGRLVGHTKGEIRRSANRQVVLHRRRALTQVQVRFIDSRRRGIQYMLTRFVVLGALLIDIGARGSTAADEEDRRKAIRSSVHIERHRRRSVRCQGDVGGEGLVVIRAADNGRTTT